MIRDKTCFDSFSFSFNRPPCYKIKAFNLMFETVEMLKKNLVLFLKVILVSTASKIEKNGRTIDSWGLIVVLLK